MKKIRIVITTALAASAVMSAASHAAPFAVQPKAGQWEITTQTLADGKDIGPRLALIKQQAAAFLKPKQLEKLNHYDPSQFNECLKPQQATLLADPQKSLEMLSQALGQCELQIDSQDAAQSRMRFSGYCNEPKHGIAGSVSGQIQYHSPTEAVGFVEGVGTLPPPIQLMLVGRVQPQIALRNDFKAQWQQAQCKPAAALE